MNDTAGSLNMPVQEKGLQLLDLDYWKTQKSEY